MGELECLQGLDYDRWWRDIIDVIKGLSLSRLGFLRVGGGGSWRVGLHGQVLVFVVLELQDLFGWFLV